MAEYIEREALLKDVFETVVYSNKESQNNSEIKGANKVIDRIMAAPTADVQEVMHGEWADYADSFWGRIGRMDLRCSLCGKRASSFVGGTEDWWDNYKPNYCPHCGAKMDKVEEELP